jgi:hypothetical protein
MIDLEDGLLDAVGLGPSSPEEDFVDDLCSGKMPKIYNCQYWLKHELFVYTNLEQKGWFVSKPSGPTRLQVPRKELAIELIKYYLQMVYLPKFENERGKELDLDKTAQLVAAYPEIKKYIDNPTLRL